MEDDGEYDGLTQTQQLEVIRQLAGDLVHTTYVRQEKALKLKKVLLKAKYLKKNDRYGYTIERKGDRALELHLLLRKDFSASLCTIVLPGDKWSDFDAYNNKETLRPTLKSGEVNLLTTHHNRIKLRLIRLEDDVIDYFNLPGMEEYKLKLKQETEQKKAKKLALTLICILPYLGG